jgi:hypothetical protein
VCEQKNDWWSVDRRLSKRLRIATGFSIGGAVLGGLGVLAFGLVATQGSGGTLGPDPAGLIGSGVLIATGGAVLLGGITAVTIIGAQRHVHRAKRPDQQTSFRLVQRPWRFDGASLSVSF